MENKGNVYVALSWVDLCKVLLMLLDGDTQKAYQHLSSIMIETRAAGERAELVKQGYDPWEADGVIIGRWGRWLGDRAPQMPKRRNEGNDRRGVSGPTP